VAKDNSFDIVSQIDLQEVDNAVNQATREISTRYDFKGTGTQISFDREAAHIAVTSSDDFYVKSAVDVLQSKLVKRGIDLKALSYGKIEQAAAGTSRQEIGLVTGIDVDTARAINKAIKTTKTKAKVQIEGEKLRVSSKSRDELQDVIAFIKSQDFGIPLQFINYR
jgi:uncharacterized protein YajQ (UPF0234 family)